MKPYPTNKIVFAEQEDKWLEASLPTPEACHEFEFYLEPAELEWYEGLSDGEKLCIRMSANPFNALARAMGRARP